MFIHKQKICFQFLAMALDMVVALYMAIGIAKVSQHLEIGSCLYRYLSQGIHENTNIRSWEFPRC